MLNAKQTADMLGITRDAGRPEDDFYETPRCATEAFLEVARPWLHTYVWEPAAGAGAISNVFAADGGFEVDATDINPRHPSVLKKDFFKIIKDGEPLYQTAIVTNPPFKLAQAFVEQSLTWLAYKREGQVAMLLRLNWIAAKRRAHLFSCFPFRCLMPFSGRLPRMHRPGYVGKQSTSMVDFAWFVWDYGWKERPYVEVLEIKK